MVSFFSIAEVLLLLLNKKDTFVDKVLEILYYY